MPFVFYDTETTGANAWYDQILQFAAIRTDDELNELERFEIRCRLLPHIVPSPGALVVTGMTIEQLINPALPSHYDMVRAIQKKLLSWSPAVIVGYNSFDFDEMLVRQALYQTLHSPYLTNTNGNSRADILQITMALNQFEPGILNFALRPDGKPSFKLDQLAPANGFVHKNAHDALADVEATIHIARIIRSQARQFWDHAIMLGSKSAAVDYAMAEPMRLYTEFHYVRPHHWLVSPIAVDPQNAGHIVSYDLVVPPDAIFKAVVGLGAALKVPVLAEGVETEQQLLFAKNSGCEELQGFHFGRPISDQLLNELYNSLDGNFSMTTTASWHDLVGSRRHLSVRPPVRVAVK